MEIKLNKQFSIASVSIENINGKEMRQMHELKNRIKNVLNSHKDNSEKKEYVSDDDLKLMHAILSVFTKEFADTQTSTFDKFLEEQNKPDKPLVEANAERALC